jgi:D-alanyl-D-alanine carboxypeptidase
MSAPLNQVVITSIYKNNAGQRLPLPRRMAQCTPDMEAAIRTLIAELSQQGGSLFLSDLFRSYDMQLQSHMDFLNGKKKAFSPPPGGSLHEAGRALDLDLDNLGMKLADFWELARPLGLSPIIDKPTPGVSESWHFDCRGSHQIVYDYYKSGKGTNFLQPYAAMAASAILSVGVKVDKFGDNQTAAAIQSALIRLGQSLGNIDGSIGTKTRTALDAVGVRFAEPQTMLTALEGLLRQKFSLEYEIHQEDPFVNAPAHVIQ